ncbi:retropepsin-like aspartic protease [Denitratisoma oestradiolicum]|nr:retropepsin-like aspartic protease [Denitratisoma oestradiolicum]
MKQDDMSKILLCIVFVAFVPASIAGNQAISDADGECVMDAYSAPDDYSGSYPLIRPHADLAKTIKAARTGDIKEQRNLAVSYATGYLVSKCMEKADYWYRLAAKGGDEVSKSWVARRDMFYKLSAGPECMESACNIFDDGMPQFLSITVDQHMKYVAPLTINGVTVTGLIDTGAYSLLIDSDTAKRMGISLEGAKQGKATVASGTSVATLTTTVSAIKVGGITLNNVEIVVGQPGSHILIGMKVLNRLKMTAAGGQMALSK